MKISIFLSGFILFTFLSCEAKTETEDLPLLVHKNYFSLTENNRKLDSISKLNSEEGLVSFDDWNEKDTHSVVGAIHFLIVDENQSFYLINYLDKMDLPIYQASIGDTLTIDTEALYENLEPIQTREITHILSKYKDKIAVDFPLLISFGLKNDTLQGDTMYRIIYFLETNQMNRYLIRKMNKTEQELKLSL